MRFLAGFAFIFVGLVCVQGQLVVPQVSTLDAIISLLPEFQKFVGHLDSILPQLTGLLSSSELQSLKDKITGVVLSQVGNHLDINALKAKLRPILQQFLGSKLQGRLDFETLLQQITNAAAGALPGLILGILGKRDTSDARANLNDLLALADKLNVNTLIPQVAQFLRPEKLQELQKQILSTVLNGLSNHGNSHTIAQALQQLISQYVPQAAQMRIDWEQIGQTALTSVASVLPGILLGALFGKRDVSDARAGLDDLLALADKLNVNTLIPQIGQFLGPEKLQELQNQFFNTVVTGLGNNWNIPTVAQALQQLFGQYVPQVAQMRIDWEKIGQAALTGVAGALPGILLGALIGKRDLNLNYQQLLAQLPVAKLAQIVQLVNSVDKKSILPTLKKLLQSFFPAYQGRINFDDLAANLLAHLNNLLPTLSQSIFSSILG